MAGLHGTAGRILRKARPYLEEGKAVCHAKRIPETILISACNDVLNLSEFDQSVFKKEIKEITVPEFNTLVYIFNDGRQIRKIWKDRSRSESWDDKARQRARECRLKREVNLSCKGQEQ